jgi:hypothetical protein
MNKPINYEIFDANGRLYSTGLLGLEVGEETKAEDIKGLLNVVFLGPGESTVEVYGRTGLLAAEDLIAKKSIRIKIKRSL